MVTHYPADRHGRADHGWLKSLFHFSFAEYYNPQRLQFGSLRVLNDDLVKAGDGFGLHPHRDMEIVSYVVTGELTHGDSMGNKNTISRGHIQYMSAGSGVMHSEYNLGKDTLRFLQIWLLPENKGLKPFYGDYRFNWEQRENQLLHLVSSQAGTAPVKVNADVNLYALELTAGRAFQFPVSSGRQVYAVQIEGVSVINGLRLQAKDALESQEEPLEIVAEETAHLLFIEMKI